MQTFPIRSSVLDLSRGKLPTPRAFRERVDLLARCRYTELIVAEPPPAAADDGWDEFERLAEDEWRKMSAYCALQGLELVRLTAGGLLVGASGDAVTAAWCSSPDDLAALPAEARVFACTDRGARPFAALCAALRAAGRPFHVSAETSARRSLAGRIEELRENLELAEREGRLNGASGYCVADWADETQWQPPVIALPALVMGGAFASSGAKAAKMDLELELDRVMDVPLGGVLLRLGTLYMFGGALRDGSSELYNILANPHGYSRHPGLTDAVLDEISGVAHGCRLVAERWTDRSGWAKELVYAANLIDCACHRRDESRLRALRDEHGLVWRLRSRESARVASLSRLPRF